MIDSVIYELTCDLADIWIIAEKGDYNYCYGGMRKAYYKESDKEVKDTLYQLMVYESHLKNRLINKALSEGALTSLEHRLPEGLPDSRIGGARCLFRPRNEELDKIFQNPDHPEFVSKIMVVLKEIGGLLNEKEGKIKLTPDFGKMAGASDLLAEFTPHSLGIDCPKGGCGGKSSYTATGINWALELLGIRKNLDKKVTVIGSNGALGIDVFAYLKMLVCEDLKVCDLEYDDKRPDDPLDLVDGFDVIPSKWGVFTDPCLSRGDIIIATTVGRELENSNLDIIPEGTLFVLAHNLAIPKGEPGIELMKKIDSMKITAIPGPVLTLGGALTSRVEWYWRQTRPGVMFDKSLAHMVVKQAVPFMLDGILKVSEKKGINIYEAMCDYASFEIH